MKLILGVVDIPYSAAPPAHRTYKAKAGLRKKAQAVKPAPAPSNVTTGDVAGWLEDRYHVMEIFFEEKKEDVAKALENSLAGAFETMLMGGNAAPSFSASASAESEIDSMFQDFLSNKEMERIGYPGVPTQAALDGVSHRFKRPYAKRAARPSFIDTGLYQSSFKSQLKD